MEDYVTFEQAKTLKELGFDWKCETFWDDEGSPKEHEWVIKNYHDYPFVDKNEDCSVLRPTLSQAQKWLREVKGIEVNSTYDMITKNGWFYYQNDLKNIGFGDLSSFGDDFYPSYEQALSAGIDKALEFLK